MATYLSVHSIGYVHSLVVWMEVGADHLPYLLLPSFLATLDTSDFHGEPNQGRSPSVCPSFCCGGDFFLLCRIRDTRIGFRLAATPLVALVVPGFQTTRRLSRSCAPIDQTRPNQTRQTHAARWLTYTIGVSLAVTPEARHHCLEANTRCERIVTQPPRHLSF